MRHLGLVNGPMPRTLASRVAGSPSPTYTAVAFGSALRPSPSRLLAVVTWVASLLSVTFLEVNVGFGVTIGLEASMDKLVRLKNVVKCTVLWSLVGARNPR